MATPIQFDTTDYQFAHGKAPRGSGQWAFTFVVDGMIPTRQGEPEICWHTGSFADAKRSARAYALTFFRDREITIKVGS